MKRTLTVVLVVLPLVLSLVLSSCTFPSVLTYNGVFEGDFVEGTRMRVISGPIHNQGWHCEAQMIHADGTVQKILLQWGEGDFEMYEWREIIDFDYMTCLYSGEYRFNYPSSTRLTLKLDSGETFKLTKTDEDPMEHSFTAHSPESRFYENPKANKYTAAQIDELKQTALSQELSYAQFADKYAVEDIIETATSYIVRLTLDDGDFVYVHIDQNSLTVTEITDDFVSQ